MSEIQTAQTLFGPRVLGEQRWEEQKAALQARSGGVTFGNRVMDAGDEQPAEPAPPDESPFLKGDALPTLQEMETILADRPDLYDDAYAAEVMASSPRKGALQLLQRLEREKDAPRENVLKVLDAQLAQLGG